MPVPATFPPKDPNLLLLLCQTHPHTRARHDTTRARGSSSSRASSSSSCVGRHGGEQQHHGVRDADGADLRRPGDRLGRVVRVGAGGGVRPPGAVAGGHPGGPHPPCRPRRLRRRLLEPPPPPRVLPLRHGVAHRAAHRAPRLRLRRHPRLRRLPGARPRLRRVPPRWLLHVAPGLRLRRPGAVGADQGVPRRLRHLQEAGAPGRVPHRRPVLPVAPLATPVRVLQAAGGVRVQLREPDGVGGAGGAAGGGRGLRGVGERPVAAVLRVRIVPRGPPRGAPRPVAPRQRRPRRRHRRPRLPLPRRLQRLQERPGRGPLPPLQVVAAAADFPPL
uniref:Uncharacterized protein n=1 Tax=Oryza rufipogon TaxID=4529 RepID=A0A0E0NBT3_ORYRU